MPRTAAPARVPKSKAPFPPFPPRFVPEGSDGGSVAALDPLFSDLEERAIRSAAELERWIEDWSELASLVSEEESRRYVAMTCHTDDKAIEKRYLDFQKEILPHAKPRWHFLKKKYAESPFRKKLDKRRYEVFDRSTVTEIELYREENVALETKDAELQTNWQKISGAQTVAFDGKEQTLPMMARLLEETDRPQRERAWKATAARRLQDRDAIDAVYDGMIGVRDTIARNAGYKTYRDYIFPAKARFDYAPDDCRRYHDAVEELVVPVLRKLHAKRRKDLKVDVLRPWDLNVDPAGAKPLRPFKGVGELVAGVRDIFHRVSPDLAKLFEGIRDLKNLDLDSRKGKAPGGYQTSFDVQRVPFIFMNAAGLHRDVMTLLHEGGHAFHSIFARAEPIHPYRSAPAEFCEVASMGMEAIGLNHIDVFYPSAGEADRARTNYFEQIFQVFPWIATIDAFQHWVYLNVGHTAGQRRQAWLGLRKRFKGGDDWTGLEVEQGSSWHAQIHPFCFPFYYIEYAIAQIGALQVWLNARKDRKRALALYRKGLSLGGSRPLPELFRTTGLKFGLDAKTLKPLIKAVAAEL